MIHPDFSDELAGVNMEELDRSAHVVYGLRPDLSVGMVNNGWYKAGGDLAPAVVPVGSIVEPLPKGLRSYYRKLYDRVLREQAVVEHEYLCPTPTHYRRFNMVCSPLVTGILVVHQLMERRQHRLKPHPPNEAIYRNDDGLVMICSHCRQVQLPDDPSAEWHWVPDWVRAAPSDTTHGICDLCLETYYC